MPRTYPSHNSAKTIHHKILSFLPESQIQVDTECLRNALQSMRLFLKAGTPNTFQKFKIFITAMQSGINTKSLFLEAFKNPQWNGEITKYIQTFSFHADAKLRGTFESFKKQLEAMPLEKSNPITSHLRVIKEAFCLPRPALDSQTPTPSHPAPIAENVNLVADEPVIPASKVARPIKTDECDTIEKTKEFLLGKFNLIFGEHKKPVGAVNITDLQIKKAITSGWRRQIQSLLLVQICHETADSTRALLPPYHLESSSAKRISPQEAESYITQLVHLLNDPGIRELSNEEKIGLMARLVVSRRKLYTRDYKRKQPEAIKARPTPSPSEPNVPHPKKRSLPKPVALEQPAPIFHKEPSIPEESIPSPHNALADPQHMATPPEFMAYHAQPAAPIPLQQQQQIPVYYFGYPGQFYMGAPPLAPPPFMQTFPYPFGTMPMGMMPNFPGFQQ